MWGQQALWETQQLWALPVRDVSFPPTGEAAIWLRDTPPLTRQVRNGDTALWQAMGLRSLIWEFSPGVNPSFPQRALGSWQITLSATVPPL